MTETTLTAIRERPLKHTPIPVRVATFWYRSVAMLIDTIPLTTLWLIVVFATGQVDTGDLPQSRWNAFDMFVDLINERPLFFVPPLLTGVAIVIGGYLAQELMFGQTVGKRLLNLTLVDGGGYRPLAIMVLIRNLMRLISVLLLGLGYWWAAFDTERRTLHDWVSGTWVIHRSDKVPRPRITPT